MICEKDNTVVGYYHPNVLIPTNLISFLNSINFTRVVYISPYKKINTTPRLTWCWGIVQPDTEFRRNSKPSAPMVGYRGLNFIPEEMPPCLQELALTCRNIAKQIRGFDPGYNSCIIGKYENGEDQIGFHTDAETFLATKFCANVTIGAERDFHFKLGDQTYGISLKTESLFFLDSLEHSLPKRKKIPNGNIRYSISFRNMANDIGIGNSYYYCRGLDGAINDTKKMEYLQEMERIQIRNK